MFLLYFTCMISLLFWKFLKRQDGSLDSLSIWFHWNNLPPCSVWYTYFWYLKHLKGAWDKFFYLFEIVSNFHFQDKYYQILISFKKKKKKKKTLHFQMPQGCSSVMYCLHCQFQVLAHHISSDSNPRPGSGISKLPPWQLCATYFCLILTENTQMFIISHSQWEEFVPASSLI